ncbi:MAG: response regulator [Pyrinomonadaceae bacterium]|nr:response regulator [Pyrinomonadaceae bacterium]
MASKVDARTTFKILYAASSEEDGLLMKTAIGSPFTDIVHVNNTADALFFASVEKFDLFLLETRFPDGNGFELCRKIKKNSPKSPVVFFTSDAAEPDRRLGLAAGAESYVLKPYFDSLTETVRHFVDVGSK